MNPQEVTIRTYQDNFEIYKEKTPNEMSGEFVAWMDAFIHLLPKNGTIFELGSAQGREARYLRDRGFIVTCTDVIPQAIALLKTEGFITSAYDFRDEPKTIWIDSFDGIIAKAVYLHATQEVFERSLSDVSTCLKDGGIFCITLKLGEGEEIETAKLGRERYFKYYSKIELEDIIKKYPHLELLTTLETKDGKWVQLLLKKHSRRSV